MSPKEVKKAFAIAVEFAAAMLEPDKVTDPIFEGFHPSSDVDKDWYFVYISFRVIKSDVVKQPVDRYKWVFTFDEKHEVRGMSAN